MIVWLNGALTEQAMARIDPADRGFTLGDGLFETIAVRGGKIRRLDAHAARLKDGCAILGLPFPAIALDDAIHSVLAANHLPDAAIRLTLTRGIAERGVLPPETPHTTLLITVANLPPAPSPARCVIATVTRRNEHSPLSRVKSLNYLDTILARQEAQARNADDAILLNAAGAIAEASASNLFIVRDGKLITPPVSEGALPGVMRAAVMQAAPTIEQSLSPEDLFTADAVFLTSSLGIRQVQSLNEKPAGNESGRLFVENIIAKQT